MIILFLPYTLFLFLVIACFNIKSKKEAMSISLMIIILFAGIRYNVGNDYPSYYDAIVFGTGEEERFELIPKYLIRLCQFFNSAFLFFLSTSIFIYSLIWKAILKLSDSCLLSILCFLGLPLLFFEGLCIVRQEMALSIVFYAYCIYLTAGEKFKFLLAVLIASQCHITALVGLFFLVPIERVPKSVHLALLIISSSLGTLFTNFAEDSLLRLIFSDYYFRYFIGEGDGSGQKMKYLYLLLSTLNMIQIYYLDKSKNMQLYRLFSFINVGFSLYLFFSYNPIFASRLSLYFIILLTIAVSYYKIKYFKRLIVRRLLAIAFVSLFYIELYLCYCAYLSEGDGNNIPYDTFITNSKAFEGMSSMTY